MIHELRGKAVVIDSDLAILYGVETRVLNQAVSRNIARFPEDFMFRLSRDETARLRSQIVISKPGRGGRRVEPLAFTEQGVAMLSGLLSSERAIAVNISIMREFVRMRRATALDASVPGRLTAVEAGLTAHENEIAEQAAVIHEICARLFRRRQRRRYLPATRRTTSRSSSA